MMTDDERGELKPTAENMRKQLQWLTSGAQPGDYLFFSYSGHGSQLPCNDADEPDGKNEILCPLDLADDWNRNSIADNYLYDTFFTNLPAGVRCLCVYDCCHSGSMEDLPCSRDFGPNSPTDVKQRFIPTPDHIKAEIDKCKQRSL